MSYSFLSPVKEMSLTEFKGNLNTLSMKELRTRNNMVYTYELTLANSSDIFKVYESPLKYFNYKEFEANMKKGDFVSVLVKNEEIEQGKTVLEIVQLAGKDKIYLSKANFLKSYNENQYLLFIIGLLILLFGALFAKGAIVQIKNEF